MVLLIMQINLIDCVTLVTSNTIEIIRTAHITGEGVLSYMRVSMERVALTVDGKNCTLLTADG